MSKVVRSSSESEEQIWETEEDDDMTEGDLGYGLGRRSGGVHEVSHLFTSRRRSDGKNFSPPPFPRKGKERSEAIFQYSEHKSLQDTYLHGSRIASYRRQSSTDSNSELSNEELRQRLHETLEEVEILKTDLEASQRQLEGKEEALKILQSMAILGKATSHTQAVLQKTVQQKKSLEKEINALQWEIEFDQNRFKNMEESWTQKYDRLNCENSVLKETLKLKTEEIKMLKSENAVLNQQYLETLAMLDIKQQKAAQENMLHDKSGFTEISGLELAVLGACLCHSPGGRPCSCARMAASTRKLLLQLKQELELLQKSKEEAYIMADAFRIAFEQQLMRKNDQALRLTQMDKMCSKAAKRINWKHLKEDGFSSQKSKKTLGQKLLGMFPSENSFKRTEDQDNPQEVLKMLIDLLNDKEEALAHQRKVSYMLARALEDKDTASKENKEKNPTEQNFPFKNPGHKTSEFSVLHDAVHSHVQIFNSLGCVCSIQHPQADPNFTRTLKRSCSLPSNFIL
ncbi:PREDICTED: coiled-coil domain-containing protein 125 isoform X1 [Galeopterus variegatus]|uniref:Coiled-coil domain-containing protein 125 isoform X1 n=1 Tax=Galeopterus variegatus TaxID=482537 RepID=A0ABM0RXQ6_GALVR|nr:PREDICTED: coiled-coil domain-containing protein 125 isoform X1 [Galeopterus variegatus]